MNAQKRSVPTSQTRRNDRTSTPVHITWHVLALTGILRSSLATVARAQGLLACSRGNATDRLPGECQHASAAIAVPADADASACNMTSVWHHNGVSAARCRCGSDTYAMNAQKRSVPTSQTRRNDRTSTPVHITWHVLALTGILRSSLATVARAQGLLACSRGNATDRLPGECQHASAAIAFPASAHASACNMTSVWHHNGVSAARWRCGSDTYAMNAQKRSVPTSQTRRNDRTSTPVHITWHVLALTGILRSSLATVARAQGLLACSRGNATDRLPGECQHASAAIAFPVDADASACNMTSVWHQSEVSAPRCRCSTDTYAMNAQKRSVPTSQTRRNERAPTRVHRPRHVLALPRILRSSLATAARGQGLLACSREFTGQPHVSPLRAHSANAQTI